MFFDFFSKKTKKPDLRFFNINLVDHCNLNCKYCDHFSPIAEERYADVKDLERDFKRIKSLVNVQYIALMGGEPLLHPNLPQIFNMCRRVLPTTTFSLFTNGILLTKQDENFWKSCYKNNISIHISRYPIKLDLANIFKLSKNIKFLFSFMVETYTKQKQCLSFHWILKVRKIKKKLIYIVGKIKVGVVILGMVSFSNVLRLDTFIILVSFLMLTYILQKMTMLIFIK